MAEHIEVARAFVTIVPSMEGSQKTIATEMGAVTEPAAKEAGEKSGKGFGESLAKGLKTTAAVIGGALTAATAAAVGTGKAFVSAANDVAAYGDSIDKNSQKMGISAQAYQEWDFILQHNGASIDGMKTSMLKLTKAAESGDDAFKALGISQEDLSKMSTEEVFAATIRGLQGIEDQGQRTVLANKLLGRGATELGSLLNSSAEDTEKMRLQLHDLGGVMSDEAVKAAANYQDELKNMDTALTGVKNNMISQFLPGISQVMNGLSKVFSGNGGIEEIKSGLQNIIGNLTSMAPQFFEIAGTLANSLIEGFGPMLPDLVSAIFSFLNEAVKSISGLIPQLVPAIVDGIKGVASALYECTPILLQAVMDMVKELITWLASGDNISKFITGVVDLVLQIATALTNPETLLPIIQAGLKIATGILDGILSALPLILEQLPVIIDNIVTTLVDGLPLILEAGIKIFMALVDALPVILDALMEALPQIINTIIDTVLKALPLLLEAAIKLFMSLIEALPKIIVMLVKELPKIITTIITTLLSRLPDLIKGAVELFMGIIKAIPQIIVELAKQMPTIIKSICEGLVAGVKDIGKVAVQLMQGLLKGLQDGLKAIGNGIKKIGDGIVGAFKKVFKIASPSKVFADDIGTMLALGLEKGWDNTVGGVTADMVGDMEGLTASMTASVSAFGPTEALGGNTSTYNGGNVTMNIYGAEGQNVNELANLIAVKLEDMTRRKEAVFA